MKKVKDDFPSTKSCLTDAKDEKLMAIHKERNAVYDNMPHSRESILPNPNFLNKDQGNLPWQKPLKTR